MSEEKCPVKINGTHYVEWMDVPASTHDGDFGIAILSGHQRGICLDCGEQFTR